VPGRPAVILHKGGSKIFFIFGDFDDWFLSQKVI
jgi:hypothetical protein